ncbi:MAG TPA: hypothetical protein VLU91_04930 [Nitrososphaerales archaeon]|nr:hypothetical protein [Nitrososphaerales archaeon]
MGSSAQRGAGNLTSLLGFRLWVAAMAGVSLVFALQPLYPGLIGPLSNLLPSACVLTAFLCSLSCLRRYGFTRRLDFGAIWFFFTIGTGMWVVAEVTWALYYFVVQVSLPYPSLADVFYTGGYLPVMAGLVGYLNTFHVALSMRRFGYTLLGIGAAVALALLFVLPVEFGQSLTPVNFLTDMIYPVFDLILLSLALLSLAIFVGGRIANWWVLFGAGATLYVIGDEFFLYLVANGTYYNGSVDDLIFILGYLTLAMAFYAHRKEF